MTDKNKHTDYLKIVDTVNPALNTEFYGNTKRYCQKKGILFVDKEFPPKKSSLVGNP